MSKEQAICNNCGKDLWIANKRYYQWKYKGKYYCSENCYAKHKLSYGNIDRRTATRDDKGVKNSE